MSAPQLGTGGVTAATVTAGFGWIAFSNYANRLLSLVTTLVLAKLLTPHDFGLVAIAAMLIEAVQVFKDMGLSEAVIFSKRNDRTSLDTAHSVLVAYNTLLFLITVAATPFISQIYEADVLLVVLPLLSSNLVVNSLRAVTLTVIRKELDYRKLALPDVVPTTISSFASIVMAATGFGIWSLVAKSMLQSLLALVVLQIVSPFRPRFAFDRAAARELLAYGRFIVGTSILLVALYNVDKLYVSRIAGVGALGVYQLAISIAELPVKQLSFLVGAVMFPVFSRMERTGPALRNTFLKTLRYTACVTLPASIGLSAFGPELVRQLYGPKWEGLDVVLRLLPLYAGLRSLSSIIYDLFKASGHPRLMQHVSAFKLASVVALGPPAVYWFGISGMAGLLVSVYAAALAWELKRLALVLESSVLDIARVLVTAVVLSIVLIPGTYAFFVVAVDVDSLGWLVASMALAGILYASGLYYFEKELAADLRTLLGSHRGAHRSAPASAP